MPTIEQTVAAAGAAYSAILQDQGNPVHQFIFRNQQSTLAAAVDVDAIRSGQIDSAPGITPNSQTPASDVYTKTSTKVIPVAVGKKYALDENFYQATGVGVPREAPMSDHELSKINNVMGKAARDVQMALNKNAIQVLETGKHTVLDASGEEVQEFDFERKAGNSLNYNLSSAGSTAKKALARLQKTLADSGYTGPSGVIADSNWISAIAADKEIQNYMQGSSWQIAGMMPAQAQNVYSGLTLNFMLQLPGFIAPIFVYSYNPPDVYKSGDTVGVYLTTNKMVMFPHNSDAGYCFYTGIQVLDANKNIETVSGSEGVIDMFSQFDPPVQWIRVRSRYFMGFPDMNHTAVMTGSNFGG